MPEAGYTKRRPKWSRDDVIQKMVEWKETYGEPPRVTDWNPSDSMSASRRSAARAGRWSRRAARFYEGEWPWSGTVSKLFGSWNEALKAAELPVRFERQRAQFDEPGTFDTDEMRGKIDAVEDALMQGKISAMRATLCELASDALAWAEDLEEAA